MDQELLGGFFLTIPAGPLDEFAVGEGRASADQGDEWGRRAQGVTARRPPLPLGWIYIYFFRCRESLSVVVVPDIQVPNVVLVVVTILVMALAVRVVTAVLSLGLMAFAVAIVRPVFFPVAMGTGVRAARHV